MIAQKSPARESACRGLELSDCFSCRKQLLLFSNKSLYFLIRPSRDCGRQEPAQGTKADQNCQLFVNTSYCAAGTDDGSQQRQTGAAARQGRPRLGAGRGSGLAAEPKPKLAAGRGGLFPPCLSRLRRAMLAPSPRRPWRAQRQQGTKGAEGTRLCPAHGPTARSSHRKRRGPRRRPRRQYERRLVNYTTDRAIFKRASLRLRYWVAAAELIDYPASLGAKRKQSGVKIGHTAFSLSCGFHVFRCCIRWQQ